MTGLLQEPDFQIICEIESATRPSLSSIRDQVGVLAPVSTALLIPDNHLGRATVSSIAAAHEVAAMGGRAIACINSRDRNRLGFQRDLLTAGAYGVHELLVVFGDRPASGGRDHDLTAATMLAESRAFNATHRDEVPPFLLGVTTRLAPLPTWKASADKLFVQVGFDLEGLFAWRQSISFSGPVYAGVLVLSSAAMAACADENHRRDHRAGPRHCPTGERPSVRSRPRHRARGCDRGVWSLRRRAPHPGRALPARSEPTRGARRRHAERTPNPNGSRPRHGAVRGRRRQRGEGGLRQ